VDAHVHTIKQAEKCKQMLSATKLMAAVFWERKGVLMEFMQQRSTITSEVFCKTLKKITCHSEKMWNADIQCNAPP
jgi:hypothetical protein